MKDDPNYEEKLLMMKLYEEFKILKKLGRPKKIKRFTHDAID